MNSEELDGVKFSEFPSQTPGNSDEVVGLHSGDNARFSIANIVAAVRNGLANIFVPKTDVGAANGVASLDNTGKVPTSQLPSSTGPEPATATPLMDGTGAVGTSTKYAREDHEHPADTNKQAKIAANGILKGDGQGGVSAAVAGTDYQAPLTAGTDYATPAQLADKANQTQLAYVESGTTATKTGGYTAGEYICWQGTLYTANTNIAYGTTLSAGTGGNLTECVGGGFNDLIRSETISLSIADTAHISNISNCQCIRIGRVCILSLACQISTTGTGWGYLINVGIVPKMQVTFSAFTSEGYRFSFAISDAGGSGVVAKAENKSIQGGYYVGSVVFPV